MSNPTKEEYAKSKYLIYSQFETKMPAHLSASTIKGSLLLDCAMTQDEAETKLAMYRQRSADLRIHFPLSSNPTTTHIYIENDPEWWSL